MSRPGSCPMSKMRPAAVLMLAAFACAAMVEMGMPAPAAAQVLDIGEDGAVTRLDGPATIHSADLRGATRLHGASAGISATRSGQIGSGQIGAGQTGAGPVLHTITEAATANQMHPALLEAVAWQESRLHQGAVSPRGAIGVMQLMPATAAGLGLDAHDPQANIHGGARQLRWLLARYNGDIVRTLAAYNAGTGAVDRYGGVPPYRETRAYVAAVLDRMASRAIMAKP